jgi:hypothetical protein
MKQEQTIKQRPANSTYKKLAVQRSEDTFVVNGNQVLHIHICGEIRNLRQVRNR